MSNIAIIRPLASSVITETGGAASVSNLKTADPKEIWIAGAAGDVHIKIDLGSRQYVDALFLGFTNLPGGVSYEAYSSNLADESDAIAFGSPSVLCPPMIDGDYTHVSILTTGRFCRYVKILLNVPNTITARAGIAFLGRAFQPQWNKEFGGGRPLIDTGGRERLFGGGFGASDGAVKSGFQWTLGDLTDAEVQELHALARRRGERLPIVVIEDPELGEPAAAVNVANMTIGGTENRTHTKTGGVEGTWDAASRSSAGIAGPCFVTFQPAQANKNFMIGLNQDPLTGIHYSTLDYALYARSDGTLNVFESANSVFGQAAYTAEDFLAAIYDERTIRYLKNGVILYESPAQAGLTLWLDTSFYSAGGAANHVCFAHMGLQERTHYGVFDRLEAYERAAPGVTRWSLRMEEWL